MKRWHCYSSTDLHNWKNEGEIFSLEKVSWADHAAFAPDCMKWQGKYYFFFPAAFNIGVAISDHPNGPFTDALGKPLIKNKEAGITSFDPCIFIDTDSIPYLYYGGHGTVGMVKLKQDLIHRAEPIRKLDLKNYNEGIWVHKKDGIYYFTYPMQIERDGKVKQLLVHSISHSPYGPFEYKGPFFDNNSRNSHHSIIEIKDKWYLFYHVQGPSPYERRVCVDYLEYNPDGTIKEVKMSKTGVKPVLR